MRFAGTWTATIATALIVAVTLLSQPRAVAAEDIVYSVSGIKVDTTAETASAAREAAIAQAQVAAMRALLNRLVLREDIARLPQLGARELRDYVQDFSVANEKSSAGRYLADFTVRFNPKRVRTLFQQYGVRFAENRSKPWLVLPLYGPAGAVVLWEDPNPWRRAWGDASLSEGLVPMVSPLGDLDDISGITAEQALAGDAERLNAMARRYGAVGVLIPQVLLVGDPDQGTANLGVTMSRFSGGNLRRLGATRYDQRQGESLRDLMVRAARDLAGSQQVAWKRSNVLNFGAKQTIPVSVEIRDLRTWLEVQRRLAQVSSVVSSDLAYLSRSEAKLNLTYVGDEEQLVRAMAQRDLGLSRGTTFETASETSTLPTVSTLGGGGGLSPLSSVRTPSWILRLQGPGS